MLGGQSCSQPVDGRQVDRLTGLNVNKIYGTERLRIVVQRLIGEQSCSQPDDGRQVDR